MRRSAVQWKQHNKTSYMEQKNDFEVRIRENLRRYLLEQGLIDERMPECPDVEDKWREVGEAYLPDGVREYGAWPTVSLGWMMFVGMALARLWDTDWENCGSRTDLYALLRDVRGYDSMDDHIMEDVLALDEDSRKKTSALVAECAGRTDSMLRHENIEPGTPEAFRAYVACLHQLYLMGMAVELKALGYRMTKA